MNFLKLLSFLTLVAANPYEDFRKRQSSSPVDMFMSQKRDIGNTMYEYMLNNGVEKRMSKWMRNKLARPRRESVEN
ncbi:Oidioi.mRNA.OKI2018_I69.chr2.g5666.t1.cds [Oikopleura dioica]|uniref:Oidioi.mRNA.OKI2018_I69.chr2.g5666.t1.cds n=1 Tax=Oikopleura dioica TaxID=34765 RepID=A0ABN7T7L6_OIKDI|nr:Oidioi.mRNA.OKI2018_I69.chr2.g5666.t1.cds [Oikopleura dioica]